MKKFLCMAISLFLVFNCLPFSGVSAAETEALLTANEADGENGPIFVEDLIGAVEGAEERKTQLLTEQIDVLQAIYPDLRIYDDLKSEVTRAEFLTMLVQLIAGDDYPLYTGFLDVEEADTELLACLGYAVEMGIVSKTDSFRPDATITYNEMLKMAVVACGYEIVAQRKGGWPSGYLGVANQIGLMDFFEKSSDLVSADDAYRLLYNVVTVSLLEQTTFGEDGSFEINKGSSILSDRFNVKIIEDIVYSNNLTSLTRELSGKGEPTITIGVHTYKNNIGKDLLGYNVRAFLLENNGQDTLISIRKYNNKEVFINDFSGMDGYTIKEKKPDGTLNKYNLFKGYSLLLNDIAAPGVKLSDYIGRDDVTLRLIDNNRDGKYDVVKIYVWKHMQVGKVDLVNKLVVESTVSDTLLDIGDDDAVYRIFDFNNGALTEITLEELQKDDILTYVSSNNSKMTTIFRSRISVAGLYNAKDEDSITVADKDYKLSLYAKNNYPHILFGLETTLGLDPTGLVVSISQFGDDYRYGWIVISEEVSRKKVEVQIFDQDGSMKILPVAEKIYIDNVPKKTTDFYDLEQTLVDDRMVKYGVNKDGELNMVDFPTVYSGNLPFAENLPERDSFTQYYSGTYSKQSNGSFGDSFMADSGTLFFSVPTTDRLNEDLYTIKSYNNFRNGATLDLRVYDLGPGTGPKVTLSFSDSVSVTMDLYTNSEVVVDIRYARNEDDEFAQQIQTYDGTQYKKYFLRDGVDISSVKLGDIIRIASYNNEIYSFIIDYSFSTNTLDSSILPSSGQIRSVYYRGYVYAYGPRMVQIWDTMNINSAVTLDKVYGVDFREQNVIFVDVYKNSDGSISDVIARYKPLSELRDYLHTGAEADFIIARIQEGSSKTKWVYRVINE